MKLPTELWYIILETHDIDTYKNSLLVNKLFYGIIKRYINDIPNKIEIKIVYHTINLTCKQIDRMHHNHICDIENPLNDKEKWFDYRILNNVNKTYIGAFSNGVIASRYDVLNLRHVYKTGLPNGIPLPANLILKEKRNKLTIKYGNCSWHTGGPSSFAICYE